MVITATKRLKGRISPRKKKTGGLPMVIRKPAIANGRPRKSAREKRADAKTKKKRIFNSTTAKADYDKKKKQHEIFTLAIAFCDHHGVKAKKCLSSNPEWAEFISVQQLKDRLNGKVTFNADGIIHQRKDQSLLTPIEEASLVKWIQDCNTARNAKSRYEIGLKIREILKARYIQNKKGGRKHVEFNEFSKNVYLGAMPSKRFFTGFFGRHPEISLKRQEKLEAKRASMTNEDMVEEHFRGVYGMIAELKDAGIMDENGLILDPRRIVNLDETPAFVDFADNKGNAKTKRVAGKDDKCIGVSTENRECNTVTMCWGLDGFNYGPQIIVAKKTITEGLAVDALKVFKDEIHEEFHCSTFGIISNTQYGVQTGDTFLDYLKKLDRELSARGINEEVVVLSDSHASRKDVRVLQYAKDHRMRLFFEPPQTSHFLQSLDQYNRQFHCRYNKAKNNLKKQLDRNMNTGDFISLVARIWKDWSSVDDRINSFAQVGILQNRVAPENIDRSQFYVQPPPKEVQKVNTTIASPVGVEKESAEYWQEKYAQAQKIIEAQANREVDPAEAGIMRVEQRQNKTKVSKVRITDSYGSANMSDLLGKRKRQQDERKNQEIIKKQRRDQIAQRKAKEDSTFQTLYAAWTRCKSGCICALGDGKSCDASKLVYCEYCNQLKKKICNSKSCKDKRAAAECNAMQIEADDDDDI
uniref:DDE-1 domain-containing protein n=1 Tax=Aureoumbra lagunensis TaxID=44058 RepID=A0A7S3NNK5_9STRA